MSLEATKHTCVSNKSKTAVACKKRKMSHPTRQMQLVAQGERKVCERAERTLEKVDGRRGGSFFTIGISACSGCIVE